MKHKLQRLLALAALLSGATGVAGAAHATEGWYGRADVGYSFDGTIDYDDLGLEGELQDDWLAGLGAGYGFQNGFRLEGEIGYRNNDSEVDFGGGIIGEGDVEVWSAMANLYYDFNRGGRFQPYLGVGVGAAQLTVDQFLFLALIDDEDTGLAYQGLAGVAFGLTDRLALDIGYRYFVVPEVELDGVSIGGPFTTETQYEQHAAMIGLRYQFGAPAAAPVAAPPPAPAPTPPPPPAPATCPQSEFVVYFEWDRSALNQSALETIDAAVNRARECNIANIVVVGHTDTSGSPQYNQGLSERRAGVVREALIARGIAEGSITAAARGESELAQQTRDGVREPLNRRTAVTISFR